MTDVITMEDDLLATGEPVPPVVRCPHCGRRSAAFAVVRQNGDYFCTTCIVEMGRAIAGWAGAMTAPADDTWEGAKGLIARERRNALVNEWLWAVLPGSPLTAPCQALVAEFLGQLHALTVTYEKPSDIVWPKPPEPVYSE